MKMLGINTEWHEDYVNNFTDIYLDKKIDFNSYDIVIIETKSLVWHYLRAKYNYKSNSAELNTLESPHILEELKSDFNHVKNELKNFLIQGKSICVFVCNSMYKNIIDKNIIENISLADLLPIQLELEFIESEYIEPIPLTGYTSFIKSISKELQAEVVFNKIDDSKPIANALNSQRCVAQLVKLYGGEIILLPATRNYDSHDSDEYFDSWVKQSKLFFNKFSKINQKDKKLNLHKELQNNFVEYLIADGFPRKNIVVEWGDRSTSYDIVVLDNSLTFPLFVFEIKLQKSNESLRNGIATLKRAINQFDMPIECALIFPSEDTPHFECYKIRNLEMTQINELYKYKFLPSYKDFQTKKDSLPANINILKQTRESKKTNSLQLMCWVIFPIIGGILILLDRFCYLLLTTERLFVYGALIILYILPLMKKNYHWRFVNVDR